jgi:uncharacterized protein HemX
LEKTLGELETKVSKRGKATGIAAVLALVGGAIYGWRNANKGKQQYEDAVSAHQTVSAENEQLQQKNTEYTAGMAEEKTRISALLNKNATSPEGGHAKQYLEAQAASAGAEKSV